mmetsp:Transcript_139923/g.390043  ORF Transcript_139923/g.390043 Transcript_139923/m.390043 type:complete len:218 (-) Transcript_139923:2553-3206(-)
MRPPLESRTRGKERTRTGKPSSACSWGARQALCRSRCASARQQRQCALDPGTGYAPSRGRAVAPSGPATCARGAAPAWTPPALTPSESSSAVGAPPPAWRLASPPGACTSSAGPPRHAPGRPPPAPRGPAASAAAAAARRCRPSRWPRCSCRKRSPRGTRATARPRRGPCDCPARASGLPPPVTALQQSQCSEGQVIAAKLWSATSASGGLPWPHRQ